MVQAHQQPIRCNNDQLGAITTNNGSSDKKNQSNESKISIDSLSADNAYGFAQETYENEKLTGSDLNGTARYVGMGGAMEALGADISTMQSNPAGIGLFRRSQVTISGGLVMQGNAPAYVKGDKTNASFG